MRLVLPLGTMFVAALLLGTISLQLFAPVQLMGENEPASRSVKAVAEALNSALLISANPQQTLDAFVQSPGTSEAIRFRHTGAEMLAYSPVEVRTLLGRVPRWFIDRLSLPGASFPVKIDGKQVGDILYSPDLGADIYEVDRLSCPITSPETSASKHCCVYGHRHPNHRKDTVAETTAKPTASASPQKLTERKRTSPKFNENGHF